MRTIIDQHVQETAATEELMRLQQYRAAWEVYYGHHVRQLAATKSDAQARDNVIVNYARVIVDKGVAFLFGQDVTFELDETQHTTEEKWLDDCLLANGGLVLFQKLATNGGVCGHAFAKLWPAQPGLRFPRVIVLDPAMVRVRWDPEDIERVVQYVISWTAIDPDRGKNVQYRQLIDRDGERWTITDQISHESGPWQTRSTEPWPWPWPPVVDCQNLVAPNEYYGLSDLPEDVQQLNNNVNFVLSNLNRIIRYHAHPKTWGKGFKAAEMDISVDGTITLPNPAAELHNLEMQSDLSASISVFNDLREALHEVASVPEIAAGKLERVGALSGLAMQILYQPLVEKTEKKRRTYGAMLVEMARRLLEMGGHGPDNHAVLHWPEMLPSNILEERQVALIDRDLGVSRDTLISRLGYDPDLERQKRETEAAALADQMLGAFDRDETA